MKSYGKINRVYGVDFSGAEDAGKSIWIAGGAVEGNLLLIEECRRAELLPGVEREGDLCLEGLREFIAKETDSAFGSDFPFDLPLEMIREKSWEDFVIKFYSLEGYVFI